MIISGNNQEVELEAIGKNVHIEVTARFDRKDLSGQTSSSETSSAGNKPKTISISMQIKVDEAENLTKLVNMADALDSNDEPEVYTVASKLCTAMNIRQVIFSERLNAKEDDTLHVFNVSFSLREYKTVAEKKEERAQANAKTETQNTDGEVKVGSIDHQKIIAAAEQ